MLTFTQIEDNPKDAVTILKVTIEAKEEGAIDDYIEAFGSFLIACGFQKETVYDVLPTFVR